MLYLWSVIIYMRVYIPVVWGKQDSQALTRTVSCLSLSNNRHHVCATLQMWALNSEAENYSSPLRMERTIPKGTKVANSKRFGVWHVYTLKYVLHWGKNSYSWNYSLLDWLSIVLQCERKVHQEQISYIRIDYYFNQHKIYENNICYVSENCSHGYFDHKNIFSLFFILERNENICFWDFRTINSINFDSNSSISIYIKWDNFFSKMFLKGILIILFDFFGTSSAKSLKQ